jgi:hypothetical protein
VNNIELSGSNRCVADVGRSSSSATVYGVPKRLPLKEDDPVGMQANSYGATGRRRNVPGVYHQLYG